MQHHGLWIRIFYRKVHFHGSSCVESHLSLWQISYLVTCHLTTRVWLSSHQFPSPTHGCCVFLFYILSLWKLIVTLNALLRRRILSSAVKEKWYTNIFIFLSVCESHSVVSNSLWPHDCSLPGFSVHEILQARILEWVAVPSSRGSSRPRDQT